MLVVLLLISLMIAFCELLNLLLPLLISWIELSSSCVSLLKLRAMISNCLRWISVFESWMLIVLVEGWFEEGGIDWSDFDAVT